MATDAGGLLQQMFQLVVTQNGLIKIQKIDVMKEIKNNLFLGMGSYVMSEKTMYSFEKDNETWYCNDIYELLQEGLSEGWLPPKENSEIVIYSGTFEAKKASVYLNDIVDMITENAYEECGEVAISWLDGSGNILQKAMEDCLDNWCDKYGKTVYFGCIENIKPIHINILKIQGDDVVWAYRDLEYSNV